jgi:hypothetical protein
MVYGLNFEYQFITMYFLLVVYLDKGGDEDVMLSFETLRTHSTLT